MTDELEIDIAILAARPVIHVDLHQRRLGADAPPVAHAKVEGRTDDDDDVRIREGVATRAIEVMRVTGREQPAAPAVEVAGNVETAQQRDGLFVPAGGPHL